MKTDLSIRLVQAPISWGNKEANLSYLNAVLQQSKEPAHVIILPELFTTGFSNNTVHAEKMNGKTIAELKTMSQKYCCILVVSVMIKEDENCFNRLCWIYPNGQINTYDKKHLFSYAQEDLFYTSGTTRSINSVNGWKLFSTICYDIRFPVWCRQKPANTEYDILVCVANWPATRITQWKSLLTARAIENQCFVIGVNRIGTDENGILYNGQSCIINPLGETVSALGDAETTSTYAFQHNAIKSIRQHFDFGQDADNFFLLPTQ